MALGFLVLAIGLLMGMSSSAMAQDPIRCTPYRMDWNNGLNQSLDLAALRALRLRITGQGLSEICDSLLAEINRQLERAEAAARAAPAPSPPRNPAPTPAADEVAWRSAQRTNTCDAYRSFVILFPSSSFTTQARRERDRLCASPSPPPQATPAPGTPAAALRAAQAGEAIANRRFSECADCPEMVAVPGGTFTLGSPSSEQGRDSDEGPQMRVTIQPFAVGRFEVTRAQYAAFVRETGRAIISGCWTANNAGTWEYLQGASWQSPGFDQTGDHPVVCVSWEDAQAYVAWINDKVGGDLYRLLTESEWEYAARAGTTTRFWWGDGEADLCSYANGADQAARSRFSSWTWTVSCNDRHVFTAPVGFSGRENRFGLADMAGNVWEWTQDCYNGTYDLTPTNGAANTTGGCSLRVIRGGSWSDIPQYLRSALRGGYAPTLRDSNLGFRLSRAL
jgi:formylglycine-generating enzyme required for sulfatase activity